MSELVRICSRAELPAEGHAKEIDLGTRSICLANIGGTVSAVDNICPHRGGPLGEGMIENGKLVCPWHAWEFDVVTGECITVPGTNVAVYPLTMQGEDVLVQL
jgi:nitrite reductase (NADH) small subunit